MRTEPRGSFLFGPSMCLIPRSAFSRFRSEKSGDFPDGPLVENSPPKAGDVGSIPGGGTKISHAVEQLSLRTTTMEPMSSRACAPKLEKACVPQQRPSAIRRKKSGQLRVRLGLLGHLIPSALLPSLYTLGWPSSDGGLWHGTQLSYSSICCTARLHRFQVYILFFLHPKSPYLFCISRITICT